MLVRLLTFVLFAGVTFSALAEGRPPRLYPHGLGYSFSEQTGLGFTYRFLDDEGGWQASGVATNHHNFLEDQELYSLGLAKGFTLGSFTPTEWLYSQLYWLVGGSWRSESYQVYLSRPNPDDQGNTSLYSQEKRWRHVALAGPVLGVEVGMLGHFSFNAEVGYKVGYDFANPDPGAALILTPGISGIFFFRF